MSFAELCQFLGMLFAFGIFVLKMIEVARSE